MNFALISDLPQGKDKLSFLLVSLQFSVLIRTLSLLTKDECIFLWLRIKGVEAGTTDGKPPLAIFGSRAGDSPRMF